MKLQLISAAAVVALAGSPAAHAFVPSSATSATSRAAQTVTTTAQQPHPLSMSTTEASAVAKPGTAEIDVAWSDLGFEFRPTKSHLKMVWTEDKGWGAAELVDSPYVNLHIGATALHYGQSCFEGLKAFAHEDDTVHIFRPDENAKR